MGAIPGNSLQFFNPQSSRSTIDEPMTETDPPLLKFAPLVCVETQH